MDIVERREFEFRTPNNLELTICDEKIANWLQGLLGEIERLRREGVEARTAYTDTLLDLSHERQRAERAEAERDALRQIAMECAAWIALHRTEGEPLTTMESATLDRLMCEKAIAVRHAIDAAWANGEEV